MAQSAKIIDITRSYIPVDPRAFPDNLIAKREDQPEDMPSVVAYEGYNFLPTSYGYKSYFGINRTIGIDALDAQVNKILMLQTATFENVLVALCADGIYIKQGDEAGAWEHAIVLDAPEEGFYKEWTYCMLMNTFYAYREGDDEYYKFAPDIVLWETADVPAPVTSFTWFWPTPGYSGATLDAGTYSYQIATIDALGRISAPTAVQTATLSDTGAISLTWTSVAGAVSYRIYRTISGVTKYFDTSYTNYLDKGTEGTELTLPDTTGTAVRYNGYYPVAQEPNFLNMAGQKGIFRAGIRLGFWDSLGSVAWSSIDDFLDFTPSIETLAGSAIFGKVKGSIVTIISHGDGFIIYATKSIVHVQQRVDATFQWDSTIILNAGISYSTQAVASNPDTQHFAYTEIGIYKITKGEPELLVPEIYDYFKSSKTPVALQMLEGRYLCFQHLEDEYITGRTQQEVVTIPATTIKLPGYTAMDNIGDPIEVVGVDMCYAMQGMRELHNSQFPGAEDQHPTEPFIDAVYNAYISNAGGGDAGAIEWGPTPCATVDPNGTEHNLSPEGVDQGKIDYMDQGANNYEWEDFFAGGADTASFFNLQLAIWRLGDQKRQAFIDAILNRAASASKSTETDTCEPSTIPTVDECSLGDWAYQFSAPHWGYTDCGFYLTRYCISKISIDRIKVNTITCEPVQGGFASPEWIEGTTLSQSPHACGTGFATPTLPQIDMSGVHWTQIADDLWEKYDAWRVACGGNSSTYKHPKSSMPSINAGNRTVTFGGIQPEYAGSGCVGSWANRGSAVAQCPVGTTPAIIPAAQVQCGTQYDVICVPDTTYIKKENMNAYNSGTVHYGIFGTDTAYFELVGWKYKDADGNTQYLAKGEGCTLPNPPEKPPVQSGGFPVDDTNGTFCSTPFETVELPDISPDPISWPAEEVTIPAGEFLLVSGSIAPIYPTYAGAFVYDLHLQKWGKLRQPYKLLLDYYPLNQQMGDIIPVDTFSMKAGLFSGDGKIHLFDEYPADSLLRYGKIGYYRLGFTSAEEVRARFRVDSTGQMLVQTSLDGQNVEAMLTRGFSFTSADQLIAQLNNSGRWHSVAFKGHFDLRHLEFRGNQAGRR